MALQYNFSVEEMIEQGRVTREQIDALKLWLQTQDYPELGEQQVVLFLLSCNCDQEATKATVKAHYTSKLTMTDFFDDRDVDRADIQHQLDVIDFTAMPNWTASGAAVVYFRLKNVPYYELDVTISIKAYLMALESLLCERNPPKGFFIILDLDRLNLMHLTRLRIGTVKNYMYYLQEGLPLKLQHIEMINANFLADKLIAVAKPFMKKEVYDMINIRCKNADLSEFYKNIPSDCLPNELGENCGTIEELMERTVTKLRELKPYFNAERELLHKFRQKPNMYNNF